MSGLCRTRLLRRLAGATTLLMALPLGAAESFDGNRWFQIEVSVFSNEYPEYRDAELWSPERLELAYPPRARHFRRVTDFFTIDDFARRVLGEFTTGPVADPDLSPDREVTPRLPEVGPFPRSNGTSLRLPDYERDAFLLLPAELSEFQTSNARLERSPYNRLLFTGLWRQPVVQAESAFPLIVQGGSQIAGRHELEGSLTLRFNRNEDRVVIDTDLWLIEFSSNGSRDSTWNLPPLPPATGQTASDAPLTSFAVTRIIQMRQSREMRSNEFHYLDHPALGVVISVHPYDLPAPATRQVSAPADTSVLPGQADDRPGPVEPQQPR